MNRSKIEEAKKVIAMIADDFYELKDSLLGISTPGKRLLIYLMASTLMVHHLRNLNKEEYQDESDNK